MRHRKHQNMTPFGIEQAVFENVKGVAEISPIPTFNLACPRGAVVSHCAAVRMVCLAARLRAVRSSTPGPGGLSVHAGQLNAYSGLNVSGKHRVFDGVLFNL